MFTNVINNQCKYDIVFKYRVDLKFLAKDLCVMKNMILLVVILRWKSCA